MENMYVDSKVSVETKDTKALKDRLVAYSTKMNECLDKKNDENKEEE